MLLVISPAKNLDYDTPVPAKRHSQPQLLDQAQLLMDDLQKLGPHQLSQLMGISDKLGVLNYDRNQNWQPPFTTSNARQAIFAFNGDVYVGLDAYSMNEEDLAFAQEHLRILSGLYGVLRPLDLIQPYRLEMGTKFANMRGKDLYTFWGTELAELLNKQLKKLKTDVLVNLASNEYFKALDRKTLQAEIVTPVFKDYKGGKYKVVSFFAKKARGLMTAYSIRNQLTDPEQLKRFNEAGYTYNEAMSNGKEWVFTRREAD
jgi:cytoplasmic iron level regulating protein YaaA (DUF328/UPF0246 family)